MMAGLSNVPSLQRLDGILNSQMAKCTYLVAGAGTRRARDPECQIRKVFWDWTAFS